ncbi:MAG: hypothetical protein R2879_01375 [Saprospiraceae bacterium]
MFSGCSGSWDTCSKQLFLLTTVSFFIFLQSWLKPNMDSLEQLLLTPIPDTQEGFDFRRPGLDVEVQKSRFFWEMYLRRGALDIAKRLITKLA